MGGTECGGTRLSGVEISVADMEWGGTECGGASLSGVGKSVADMGWGGTECGVARLSGVEISLADMDFPCRNRSRPELKRTHSVQNGQLILCYSINMVMSTFVISAIGLVMFML